MRAGGGGENTDEHVLIHVFDAEGTDVECEAGIGSIETVVKYYTPRVGCSGGHDVGDLAEC